MILDKYGREIDLPRTCGFAPPQESFHVKAVSSQDSVPSCHVYAVSSQFLPEPFQDSIAEGAD